MPNAFMPDFEAKVLLDASKVLNEKNKLRDEVAAAFGVTKGVKKISVQFVDDDKQTMYKAGWNLRIRKAEGDKDFELTYKKRYPIDKKLGPNEAAIDLAVASANNDSFSSDAEFVAQVEVGYEQQTLSISAEGHAPDEGFNELDLPQADVAADILIAQMPSELKHWGAENWGVASLSNPVVYGPVHAKRYKGNWNGLKLSIEMWPIRKSWEDDTLVPIVEASFKATKSKDAFEGQAKLADFARCQGWLLAEDSLKTKLIMERYGKTS